MSGLHWRGIARILHRDLGYLFFGATVVYAASGIALNHRNHWNPSYSITRHELVVPPAELAGPVAEAEATALLQRAGVTGAYQKHYAPSASQVRIFYQGGTATLDRERGMFVAETLARRPLLHTFNKLHYNPGAWWLWFADAFSVALIVIAVTGLFLLRGRHGLTRRGGVLVALGVIVPTALVLAYL